MGKSKKKVQRKKIDVSKETEVFSKSYLKEAAKGEKKTSDIFFEDKTSAKGSSKRNWKNKKLHCDLVVSSDKKRVIDTKIAGLDYLNSRYKLEKLAKHPERSLPKKGMKGVGAYDLWDSKPVDIHHKVEDHTGGWLAGVTTGHVFRSAKKRVTSDVAPVELPGNEESYIPQPEAYNELVEKEVRSLERLDAKNKKFDKAFNKINISKVASRDESERQRIHHVIDDAIEDHYVRMPGSDEIERRSSDADSHKTSQAVSAASDKDGIVSDKSAEGFPVVAKMKQEARLRKQNKKSENKGVPKNPNAFKKFVNRQLNDIERISAEVDSKVAAAAQKAILRKNRLKVMRKRPGFNLSKYRFMDQSKLLLTPDQMPGSLRAMPNTSSLLRDRFVNLQKRNIIATFKKRTETVPPSRKIKFVERKIIRKGLERYDGDVVEYLKSL